MPSQSSRFVSLSHFSTLHVCYLYLGLILLLVAPSWWRSAIKAHPERWVAVIHSLAEQTSVKDNTVPNISRGWLEYFRLPSYCPRHFFLLSNLYFGFNLQWKRKWNSVLSPTWQCLTNCFLSKKRRFLERSSKSGKLIWHRSAALAVVLLSLVCINRHHYCEQLF